MIVFDDITYQNFLASGNAPITIRLSEHASTLIVGRNGSGKSTMSEAISFALFGRPLRPINKPKLVNSINGRDTLVTLNFRIGNNRYQIKRGIKPAIFEIYQNGALIPAPAAVADYQTLLETNILHLNYKSFMQVVVLGSASYVPFMRLTTQGRREIIEDLLDIEVFSSMNALTKDELSQVRVELDKCSQAKHLLSEQQRMAQTFNEHIEEERTVKIASLQESIDAEQAVLDKLLSEHAELSTELERFEGVRERAQQARSKRREHEKTLDLIETREKKIRKEREFYDEHDTCSTCEQAISEDFKQNRYKALTERQTLAERATTQCKALIAKYQQQEDDADAELEQSAELERKIATIAAQMPIHTRRLKDLRDELRTTQTPKAVPAIDLVDLARQITDNDDKHAKLSREKVIMDAAGMLLKDGGIKSRVIRHYIPIINRTINGYLQALDFPILFTLDEEFNENIKSRHRDDFTYYSFSEGEKKRIDLALLLTWRAVARLKNSASTNLLILDEVFDSSLDTAGTEEFLKVIAGLEKDTNVFVISHKADQLVDKFTHTLTFEKTRGFSTLKS